MDPRIFVVLAGLAGAASLQGSIGEANAERRANDFRYTPDPRVMRVVAGAHRSSFADMLWLRALPDMGRSFNDAALKKRWIAGATDVITDLEPTFGTVYSYGAAHLNIVDRKPDEAIALLEKGIAKNPGSAGLYVSLAMVYYEFKRDRAKTVELLEKAAALPGCDSLSIAMLAAMRVESHEDIVALYYWSKALEEAPNRKIRTISEFELWRTKALIAGRASREYEAQRFQKANGRPPQNLEERCDPRFAAKSPADLRDPKLMDPGVFDLVLTGLTLDERGLPHYARMDEVDVERLLYLAEDYVAGFLGGTGRVPTEKEFLSNFGEMPKPPRGKRWAYADGKLRLADAE